MEIDYDRCSVSRRLKAEIIKKKGQDFWDTLSQGLTLPADDMEEKQCSTCMRVFLNKLRAMAPEEEIKAILVNVRHDMRREDFDWAVRLFQKFGNIDHFAESLQQIQVGEVLSAFESQKTYYGQVIDQEGMDHINSIRNIFYGRRYGNEILAEAIPANIHGLLNAVDEPHRRYALCHCQFARESILQEEGPVPGILCECSLGHTMAMWEAVLDRKLEGEVVESALRGSRRCLFRIQLPEDVIDRWTEK